MTGRGECLFILDAPHYHRVRLGAREVVRGLALAVDGADVLAVTAHRAGETLLEMPVGLPSPDIARLLGSKRAAASCRFAGELRLDPSFPVELRARREDGREERPSGEDDGPA